MCSILTDCGYLGRVVVAVLWGLTALGNGKGHGHGLMGFKVADFYVGFVRDVLCGSNIAQMYG